MARRVAQAAPAGQVLYLPSRLQLPRRWGVIEVDGARATRIACPEKRTPEPLPDGFIKALLRAAGGAVRRELEGQGDAPRRAIGGRLSRAFIWFEGCLHRQLEPLAKRPQATAPCFSCAEHLPPHPEAVTAALEAADPEQLVRYRARVDELLGVHPRGTEGFVLVEGTTDAAARVRAERAAKGGV